MNDFLKQLFGGYYNYTPPETFSGEKNPHATDGVPPERLRETMQGYGNITPPPNNLKGDVTPHYSREILEDRTKNLPEGFLSPEQRTRYYLSQDLENLGKRVGKVRNKGDERLKTLLDMVNSNFYKTPTTRRN